MKDTLLSLGEFLDVLHDAALIVDRDGRIVFASRAVTGVFGHEPAELVGCDLRVLIPPRSRECHAGGAAAFREHGTTTSMGDRPVLHGLHRDGCEVAVSISLSNIDLEGARFTIALVRDASRVKHALGAALARAETDVLTGLGNRLHLSRRLEALLADASRPFVLAYLDLARFKSLNDLHGHRVGDEVLRVVAGRLRAHVRRQDVAARLGGDEFVLVFDGIGRDAAMPRVARLVRALEDPMHLTALEARVGVDIGLACFPDDGRTEAALLAHADQAMYAAKRAAAAARGGRDER